MKRALIFAIAFVIISSAARAEQNVGKIIQLVNDVDITSLTTGNKIAPNIGFLINTDHKVRTGKRSFVEILLNNGTRIQVKDVSVINISTLKIEQGDQPTRIRLLTGKVRVSMKKIFRDGHSLILKTPTAIAGVRGTEFGVIASMLETKIIVFEGRLDIASSSPSILKSHEMRDRDECDIKKDHEPTRPRVVPENLLDTWFDRYEIDESNHIILKTSGKEGILDSILRKRGC